jgi:hypothetical protein
MAVSANRRRGQFAAERDRLAVLRALFCNLAQRAQHRRRDGVESPGDPHIAAVHGIHELEQVVGADREEVHPREQLVELVEKRGHFQHGADLDPLRQCVTMPAQMRQLVLDQRLALVEFLDCRHHREHDLQRTAGGGAQQRADLAAHQAGPVEAEADRAPAHRGVLFLEGVHIGQHLVAADIQRAERHRPLLGRIQHCAIECVLLVDARERGRHHELQFGAEQADALRAGLGDMRQVDQETGIDQQGDLLAVLADARLVAQRLILRLAASAQAHALGIGAFDIGGRAQEHFAGNAVDDDRIAGFDEAGDVLHLADRGDAERARDDGHMRCRPAFLQDQTAQPLAVVVEQGRGTHHARDHDGIVRQLLAARRVIHAHQLPHQAIGEIVEIVQALAQIRVCGAQHARTRIRLHALDAGLRGEAGRHRLAHAIEPAAVMREHAVGFQHLARFGTVGDFAAFQHHVDIGAQRRDRVVEALEFLLYVIGDKVLDDHARLVQHDVTERDAFRQRGAGDVAARAHRGLCSRPGERGQFAGSDHLRQHHGGGLQRLDFFLGIGSVRAVLHDQHAERVAGAQDRHAEEGVVDFFAGFRAVRIGGMRLRVRQVDRIGLAGDQADQAFVDAHHRQVHGFALQTFGGVQLKGAVHAQDVDGTHLRHHVGGDQHHDLVETLLRADRFRHDFAEPAQQNARTAKCATHGVRSLKL